MAQSTLIYGGSFNPIHHGHLICARAVAETVGYARVLLVPSGQPPHKGQSAGKEGSRDVVISAEHRLAMCRLAVEGNDLFDVSDIEIQRHGSSYTIETARQLRRQGAEQVNWLIGGDTVPRLPTWHEPAALLAEVNFIVMTRAGWTLDWDELPPGYRQLRENVVQAPLIEISATEIRRRIAEGRSIEFMTPPGVVRYIRELNLYRSQ